MWRPAASTRDECGARGGETAPRGSYRTSQRQPEASSLRLPRPVAGVSVVAPLAAPSADTPELGHDLTVAGITGRWPAAFRFFGAELAH